MLRELNDKQYEAVTTEKGPLLILAGAGSGKTKALTYRIAHLINERSIPAHRILAVTFTNKAASEMKERLHDLIGDEAGFLWIGTFHSIAIRMLRQHATEAGFRKDFTIYDSYDQRTLIKQCMQELGMNLEKYPPKMVRSIISKAKSQMIHKEDYVHYVEDYFQEVYRLYEKRLADADAMDFDNILLNVAELFRKHPEVLEKYQSKFDEILVDEYQDTNRIQYHIVHELSKVKGNIIVVGDVDQSIYGWRGAEIRNILEFQKDFKDAKVVKLEQNYRSTKTILNAANALIENNPNRPPKSLWTEGRRGDKIIVYHGDSDSMEADFITADIEKKRAEGIPLNEIAILYRTHAQSRLLEEKLRFREIPYQMVGGTEFYQRKEIKDALAYLRVLVNERDDISFERILGVPKRGLGTKFVETIRKIADVENISLYEATQLALEEEVLSTRYANAAKGLIDLFENLKESLVESDIYEVTRKLLDQSGYIRMLEESKATEDASRLENIGELLNDVLVYSQNEAGSIEEYLVNVSLMSEVDSFEDQRAVTLMTLHSSKGLEFNHVYLAGMDDNIFPSFLSKDDPQGLEEERRLCYVGITRARESLVMTRANRRMRFGQLQYMEPSIFLEELPKETVKVQGSTKKSPIQMSQTFLKREPVGEHFSPGDRVLHHKFGQGTVINFKEDERTVEIVFESTGIRKLHIDYAPIKKVTG